MAAIDNTLGYDWISADYIGDGVYVMDTTVHQGVLSIGLRTDRPSNGSNVIVLEAKQVHAVAQHVHQVKAKWERIQREEKAEQEAEGASADGTS